MTLIQSSTKPRVSVRSLLTANDFDTSVCQADCLGKCDLFTWASDTLHLTDSESDFDTAGQISTS